MQIKMSQSLDVHGLGGKDEAFEFHTEGNKEMVRGLVTRSEQKVQSDTAVSDLGLEVTA